MTKVFLILLVNLLLQTAPFDVSMQKIFRSARSGTPEEILRLIEEGEDVNAVYTVPGNYPIKYKAGRSFPVNFLPPSGWTPLMFAAAYNGPEAVQALLDAGADIDARCPWGRTAFMHAAARNSNVEVLRTLWATGKIRIDDESYTRYNVVCSNAFGLAATSASNPAVLAFLLECGAVIDRSDKRGYRPITLAAQHNPNPAILRYLLDEGAAVEDYLLSWALKMNTGGLAIVTTLLEAGCKAGAFAVENVLENGADIAIFRKLFKAGMDDRSYGLSRNHGYQYGDVLSFGLEKTGNLALIRFLYRADRPKILTRLFNSVYYLGMSTFPRFLKITGDVGAVDEKGRNLLLFFLQKGNEYPELVTEILDAGVNVNARDLEGNTALMYARSTGTLSLLMKRGADPNVRDFEGGTLLQAAVRQPTIVLRRGISEDVWERSKERIDVLLKYGANPDGRDLSGKNAWDYAAGNPDSRVLAYLRENAYSLRFRPMGAVPEGRPITPRVIPPQEAAQWAERWLAANKAFGLGDSVRQIVEYGKGASGSYLIIVAPNGWMSVGKTEENFGPYNFSEGSIDRRRFEQSFWGMLSGADNEEGRVVYEDTP